MASYVPNYFSATNIDSTQVTVSANIVANFNGCKHNLSLFMHRSKAKTLFIFTNPKPNSGIYSDYTHIHTHTHTQSLTFTSFCMYIGSGDVSHECET
jgi:hypothetical protein